MDDEQKAQRQEFDKLHRERHELNRQVDALEKVNQQQGHRIRYLESTILDTIADLKGSIDE